MLATLTPSWRWAGLKHASALLIGCALASSAVASTEEDRRLGVAPPVQYPLQSSTAEARGAAPGLQERLLLIDINRQQLDEPALVLESDTGELYLQSRDLQRWRVRLPDARYGVTHLGEVFFALNAIAPGEHVYDHQELTLKMELRADAFESSRLTTRYDLLPPPVKPGPGGFINYDLLLSKAPQANEASGLLELGYFNRLGVGTTSLLLNGSPDQASVMRLASTWTIDEPEKMRSLRLGDAINVPGSWGRSVQFGGIQYGTNFGTNPGYVTLPAQSAAGQAVLPSTVDVFINNALVAHQTVPPGPFSISNLPVISGAGEVQLVVRDLLGREQIISRPFYASQSLLRSGLKSFSVELGLVRENFGIHSNDYGNWLASGTYRRGLTEHFTGEMHAEAMAGQWTAGAGGDYLLPKVGLLSAYAAGSHSNIANGSMVILGFERQAQPWSVGARTQWTSPGFAQVGSPALLAPLSPVLSTTLSASYSAAGLGSVSMAYLEQRNRDQADTRIATLSYNVSLGKTATLSVAALRDLAGDSGTTLFAMLSMTLNPSTNLSASSQHVRGSGAANSNEYSTSVQRNLPLGEGYGYRLHAGSEGTQEAGLFLQNNVGTYSLEAAQNQGATAARIGASGGIAFLGGAAFASRRIEQSFAVAHIADYPNVRVLTDNQPAGRTDALGNALLPRLRAYDINVVSLDQRDLPMDAQIGAIKVEVVPYYRSGIDVRFPIKRVHGATLSIALEDGTALPLGASVKLVGSETEFTVGYAGEVYVVGFATTNTIRASWGKQSCTFDVTYIASADPLPDLGRYVCKGATP